MKRSHPNAIALLLASIALFTSAHAIGATNSSAAPKPAVFTQEVYVWQRVWSEPVLKSLEQHAQEFAGLTALNAEITWKGGQPQLVRVPVNYVALEKSQHPIGLALRIGAYNGPFSSQSPATRFVVQTAASLVNNPELQKLKLAELQIDFDCAESKLGGYRTWLEEIRAKIAPIPLVITALPSWLHQSSFKNLVAAANGFVLQVHSLEKPRSPDTPFSLCDPAAALRAVERAGEFHVPFRVALPTYGYVIAFDASGRFVGLSAEGSAKSWPQDIRIREVRADPQQIAALLAAWSTNRPPTLKGVIWYRLPVADDNLNWRWPTLRAMMQSRAPHESVRAASRRVETGLVEINLVNDGELDISSRLAVEVRWQNARLVASDGLRGFQAVDEGSSALRFQTQSQSFRLPAGEQRVIGWLRFNTDREVQVEIKKW